MMPAIAIDLLSKRRRSMSNQFRPYKLAVVSIRVGEDLNQAVHFYQDVVGLTFLKHHGHRPAFELQEGSYLVLLNETSDRVQDRLGFPILAFAVESVEAAVGHLKAHNVALEQEIVRGEQADWITFRDPAGNLLEFAQFKD